MKLAASCIGWKSEEMDEALGILRSAGFAGVEIAPSMVAGPRPYENIQAARAFARHTQQKFGLEVCSLQSIWYGQSGSIFGPERGALLEYTKGAVCFAEAAGAKNLVFGCPKNRVKPAGADDTAAVSFFTVAAEYAAAHGTVFALEANPPVYGTNFMNTTAEALEMVRRVGHPGCRLNLDFGTMLVNGETVKSLAGSVHLINHVHISEPELAPVEQREGHRTLAAQLEAEGYEGFVSIEMKCQPLAVLRRCAAYIAEVFA